MKKQINPTIKAHLIRGAFYLLLLLAVCAIPFALAQRNAAKRSVTKPAIKPNVAANMSLPQAGQSADGVLRPPARPSAPAATDISKASAPWRQSSAVTSGPTGGTAIKNLRMPAYPQVVLYDQYDNDLNNGIVSANRTDSPPLSAEAADNFVVPGGQTWTVTEVDIRSPAGFPLPTSFAVTFYLDNGSGFPGTQVYTASGLAVTGNPDYVITLTVPAVLSSGTYWVSAVGTISGTNWYWEGRSVTNNTFSTAWRNPGNGYGTGCTDWGRLTTCIGINWPDQMFRIVGTTGGGGTCANYDFTLGTATFVPGVDDIGSHCDDCDTPITLPFSVTLYDQTFTAAEVGSNGHLTFGSDNATFGITCSPFGVAGTTYAQGPYWGDQCTGACASITCDTCGIFTTTTGTAPNRIFYIEWRTQYYNQAQTLNYEVALYENGTPPFQYIYNTITPAGVANDSELVVGVKKDDSNFNQYGCDPTGGQAPPVSSGQALTASCVQASPTPTTYAYR